MVWFLHWRLIVSYLWCWNRISDLSFLNELKIGPKLLSIWEYFAWFLELFDILVSLTLVLYFYCKFVQTIHFKCGIRWNSLYWYLYLELALLSIGLRLIPNIFSLTQLENELLFDFQNGKTRRIRQESALVYIICFVGKVREATWKCEGFL